MTFEAIIPDVSRAEHDEAGGILFAAAQLVRDAADAGGASALLRRSLIVVRDDVYDGPLTVAARSGRTTA